MPRSYDDTLPYRIAFGLTFFAALALWEAARNGKRSARLHEYGFLLFATTISIAFAVLDPLEPAEVEDRAPDGAVVVLRHLCVTLLRVPSPTGAGAPSSRRAA